ncbi:PiggyBac transposable element-derived protein 4 [Plakobranchus ocellatus]|uniref:PiggyBac transposable element-derived protein 4 n=1 Tax=Plakobranchus ocellatus TaxID=259542 RepID=A0AAV4A719_9GAST|nr:PiggyBac transposable element-derived protein 4 [Plakobranchus ocellatus]
MKIREIALKLEILKRTVHEIIHDTLGYRKVSARWDPKMLTEDHKFQRVEISQRLLQRCQQDNGDEDTTHIGVGPGGDFQANNNLFENLITGDELGLPENQLVFTTAEEDGQDDNGHGRDFVAPRKWKKVEKDDCSGEFNHTQGPVLEEFKSCSRPVDFFLKFFDRTLEENIVFQTNLYAQQKQRVVTPITLQDLRGFLGINVVMKYHVLPSYTHYWSSEPDLGVEIVASTMTKSRFQALLSNLHVNNEANATENDKLWKLRPLIDRLDLNFGKLWHTEKEKGQLFCE